MCGYGEIEELQLSTQPPRGLWSTVSACRIRGHHKNTSQCSGWLICDVSILGQCYLSLSRPLQDFPKVGPWAPQYSSSMDQEPKSLHFKILLGYWYGYSLSFIYSCMDASQGDCEPKSSGRATNTFFWSCTEGRVVSDGRAEGVDHRSRAG